MLAVLLAASLLFSSTLNYPAYASDGDSVMEGGIVILDNDASGSSEESSQTEAVDADTENETVIETESETEPEAVVSGESGMEPEETTETPDETESETGDETETETETPEENTETSTPPNTEKTDGKTEEPEAENSVSGNDAVPGDDAETQGEAPVKEHDYASELEGDISVAVDLLEGTELPDGAALEVERLGIDAPEYADALSAVLEGLALPEGSKPEASLYDVRFVANGEEVEPSGRVRVTVKFDGLSGDASGRTVVHVKGDGTAETLDAEWFDDGSVTFEVDSFSVFGFVKMLSDNGFQMMEAGDNDFITWGNVDNVTPKDEGGVRTWDISKTTRRYVEIPVMINISGSEELKVTLPKYLKGDFLRTGTPDVEINTVGVTAGWTVSEQENNGQKEVVIGHTMEGEGGQHTSVAVIYRFDCWNVISEREFEIPYTIEKGDAKTQNKLTGKIVTECGVTFDQYFFDWGDSAYSLSAFGGADKYMSYISGWSTVYDKYFDEKSFDNANYLYDVAPFLVKPTGQQPYDIEGTLTLDQGGEVIGAVYMMDSFAGSNAPWKQLNIEKKNNGCTFTFGHEEAFQNSATDFATMYTHDIDKLVDAVVTGDLSDPVDKKNYTLYFLVRYPKTSLQKKGDLNNIVEINADLSLKHKGVDSQTEQTDTKKQLLYRGQLGDTRIYWASYVNNAVNNRKALTALEKGMPVNLDFAADFFCLNEARSNFSKDDPKKYTLQAIIDLSYLTKNLTGAELKDANQLTKGDYRFSAFDLTLVDAPGSWSQDWNFGTTTDPADPSKTVPDYNNNWIGTPNVGWTLETWGKPPANQSYDDIRVYGSEELDGDQWTEIETIPVDKIWALNQDRNFRTGQEQTTEVSIPKENNYVRLKVEYDSRWTTALRVGYQLELQPQIFKTHQTDYNKDKDKQELTCWLNYMGYNGAPSASTADKTGMNFQKYPTADGGGWDDNSAGTIVKARQYDNSLTNVTGYNSNTGVWDSGYSFRNFAKATLGRFEESAGMLITQALYDSNNQLIGDPNSLSLTAKDSYCLKDSVINVSEIVFNLSGAITDGSSNAQELEEYRAWLNDPENQELINQSEDLKSKKALYNSTKMRYYVLLPEGMKLNLNPDDGHDKDENNAPWFHFWTKGTDDWLSASSSFYNNHSPKVVQGGETDVPVSKSNIPGWERASANGLLSEMWWVAGSGKSGKTGHAKVVDGTEGRQLVVFERELAPEVLGERFNMWGTSETYFWGRGLSFSIVPENGAGNFAAGDYTTYVWCQYLDDNGDPIKIDDFRTGTFNKDKDSVDENTETRDVNGQLLKDSGITDQEADTLLYIPIEFKNRSGSGSTYASIKLESDVKDENGSPIVQFEKDYQYRLDYAVEDRTSTNVVLWTNIEEQIENDPWYQGTVTGVDLSTLPESIRNQVKVYVKNEKFNPNEYIGEGEKGASKEWLTDETHGWTEVQNIEENNWSQVKAIAFSFENVTFNATDIKSATVEIKMRGPSRDGYLNLDDGQQEKTYYAVSPLIFSDTHQRENENANACTQANKVPVSVTIRTLTLPATGGFGATNFVLVGLLLCMGGAAIPLWTRRRRHRTGRGDPCRM